MLGEATVRLIKTNLDYSGVIVGNPKPNNVNRVQGSGFEEYSIQELIVFGRIGQHRV